MMKNINSSFNVKVIGQKKELSLEESRILFPYSRKFRFPFELKRSRIKETLKSHSYIREDGRYFTEIVRERRRRGKEKKRRRNGKWVNAILQRHCHVCYCRSTFQDCIDPFFVPVSFPPLPLYPPLKSEGVKKELYNKKRNVHCVSWLFKLLSVLNSRYFCNKIIILLLLGNEKRSPIKRSVS